jgi:hypothetical protein
MAADEHNWYASLQARLALSLPRRLPF